MNDMKGNRRKRISYIFFFTAALMWWSVSYAYADDIVDWLRNNSEIMEQGSMMKDGLRGLEWFITGILAKLASACQGLYDVSFGMIDITTDPEVNEFILKWKPVVIAVTALCLFVLGLTLIIEHEKKPKIVNNLMIMVLCITCSLTAFNSMNQLVRSLKGGVFEGEKGNEISAYTMINDSMTDLVYLNKKYEGLEHFNWSNAKGEDMGAGISGPEDFKSINFTEKLNFLSEKYEWKGETEEILKYKIYSYYEGNEKRYDKQEVDTGVHLLKDNSADEMALMNEFYYRYTLDVFPTWIQLCGLIIIYLTMSYKCVRVVFELIVARLLAYVYSAELSGGEKIRKILVFIRDSYILLVVSCLCIKVYIIFNEYIKTQIEGDTLIRSLFSLFIAFCVIDGPNLVEKLLGMDAGLKSSTARLMAIGGTAMGVAKSAGRTVKGASPKNMANRINSVRSGKVSQGGVMAGIYGAASNMAEDKKAEQDGRNKQTVPEDKGQTGKRGVSPDTSSDINGSDVSHNSSAASALNEGTADETVVPRAEGEQRDTAAKAGTAAETDRSSGGRTKLNSLSGEKQSAGKRKVNTNHNFMDAGGKKRRAGTTSLPERKTTTKSRYTGSGNILNRPADDVKKERGEQGPKEKRNLRKDPPVE